MLRSTRQHQYSDLDLDFFVDSTTKDIVKKTGVDAIKRSVRNLILTNFYDRKFRSWIGSNCQKILFDNINPFTATFLKDSITEVIENFEPRVKLVDDIDRGVLVTVSADNNGYDVRISFIVVNTGQLDSLSIFLERIR